MAAFSGKRSSLVTHRVSTERSRLEWRLACTRHQESFVQIVRSVGIEDEADMELIRRRFLVWWSLAAPATYFEIVSTRRCGGCVAEERKLDLTRGVAKLIELAKELLSSRL
ncbi:MAG TPA: hypothetical protein VMA53_12600 [Stellaceae bacterium]|nr:hypothetical protein [Stellaceae bacterium]